MKRGHVPVRQCIGCRIRRPKAELIGLKAVGSEVLISRPKEGKAGRGCYVCPSRECITAGLSKRILERALRCEISAIPSTEEMLIRAGIKGVTEWHC